MQGVDIHLGMKFGTPFSFQSDIRCSCLQYLGLMIGQLDDYNLPDSSTMLEVTNDISGEDATNSNTSKGHLKRIKCRLIDNNN